MTMKAILAGAAMMLAAGLPAAAAAQNAITSATVNFRASPNGADIGTIPNGTPVTVLGQSGNWCQTAWRGRVGWVYCRYVHTGVAQAPRVVPEPYYEPHYAYPYGYPYRHRGPSVGFSLGFDAFDRGFRHRDRPRRHGSRFFRDHREHPRRGGRGGHGHGGRGGGGGGGGGGGSSGGSGYLVR